MVVQKPVVVLTIIKLNVFVFFLWMFFGYANPLMTNTFAYFTNPSHGIYFPGSAFLLGAVFMIASTAVAYFSLHKQMRLAKL